LKIRIISNKLYKLKVSELEKEIVYAWLKFCGKLKLNEKCGPRVEE
jgi:hypothetical protein